MKITFDERVLHLATCGNKITLELGEILAIRKLSLKMNSQDQRGWMLMLTYSNFNSCFAFLRMLDSHPPLSLLPYASYDSYIWRAKYNFIVDRLMCLRHISEGETHTWHYPQGWAPVARHVRGTRKSNYCYSAKWTQY